MKIGVNEFRWTCPSEWLTFKTTEELDSTDRIEGQTDAVDALIYGLSAKSEQQHIYVRGMTGVGRLGLLKQLAGDVPSFCPPADDKCYVHNFQDPLRPTLLQLPRGKAKPFKAAMDNIIRFVRSELPDVLDSDATRTGRARINHAAQLALKKIGEPFEDSLKAQGLALVPTESGDTVVPSILPVIEGKPTTIAEFTEMRSDGRLSAEDADIALTHLAEATERFREVASESQKIQAEFTDQVRVLFADEARRVVRAQLLGVHEIADSAGVLEFLDAVEEDLVVERLRDLADPTFLRLYEVNIVSSETASTPTPVVIECHPNARNLFGTIDTRWTQSGLPFSDHMMIETGSLVAADGGYLLLEVLDVLEEPGLWRQLTQTLRGKGVDLAGFTSRSSTPGNALKPDPIPIKVKVILVGSHESYALLDGNDPHFGDLFKILADFDDSIERTETNVKMFATVISSIARREQLLPVCSTGVAALAEHGARIAGEKDRITMRFGRVSDILREADWIARRRAATTVDATDIIGAVDNGRRRADLPVRRFRRMIQSGDIRIDVAGREVGQINGLAVSRTGPLTYGFPARITASVGAGSGGTINIEREANLSGSIHTKGFGIVEGLMRQLIRVDHPLTFTASIAFEQTYGGIDGDSASCAEICVLLSALADISLRQDLAITGAVDQKGYVLPIGGATEKVEGFFSACRDLGFSGAQGVIIPRANIGDLNLRQEVVDEAQAGRFSVYAVSTVYEALALLSAMETEARQAEGYRVGTFLAAVEEKVTEYWRLISKSS